VPDLVLTLDRIGFGREVPFAVVDISDKRLPLDADQIGRSVAVQIADSMDVAAVLVEARVRRDRRELEVSLVAQDHPLRRMVSALADQQVELPVAVDVDQDGAALEE